jgi:CubicO group peptidase (beta-lactamase class C family)
MKSSLQPYVSNGSLAGAVALVADKQGVRSVEAVGWRDIGARKRMRPDTFFWIASQTKSMTATAFMMLVDEGRVKLDDPVEAFLPEFKGQRVAMNLDDDTILLRRTKAPITIRQILSHTSGLPFKSQLEEPVRDLIGLETTVKSYGMTPLNFEPGTRYLYSNAGFNTAGRIIEVLSGLPYETFMRTRLLDPLGMTETVFRPTPRQLRRLAKAYKPDAAGTGLEETGMPQYTQPFSDPRRQAVPGGGLFSTAADVAVFCRMILNGGILDGRRYISEAALAEMTRKQTPDGAPESYGLGWNVRDDGFGHGGAMSTNMAIDTKMGLAMVFMVQHSGFPRDGGEALGAFLTSSKIRHRPA